MTRPASTLRDRIRLSAAAPGTETLDRVIAGEIQDTARRSRKDRLRELNAEIIGAALDLDRPDLIVATRNFTYEEFSAWSADLLGRYINTGNEAWFAAITRISENLEKKGDQSDMQARMCRMLIDAGTTGSSRRLIEKGMLFFDKISFRKYRSDTLAAIAPPLIDWALLQGDVPFLHSVHAISGGITDISKRSVIHAKLAIALSTLGTTQKDLGLWADAVRTAAGIRQKSRRQACIQSVVQAAVASPLVHSVTDIPQVTGVLPDLPEEILNEVIAAMLSRVIVAENRRENALSTISGIIAAIPSAEPVIVKVLLRQAELSGDPWFLEQALAVQGQKTGSGIYPANEFVRAAIAVFRTTGSTTALRQVIPAIIASCSPVPATRTLLRIVQVLLEHQELSEALAVFIQARNGSAGKNPLYDECQAAIFRHAILSDKTGQVATTLNIPPGDRRWRGAIERAAAEICRQHAFFEIAAHAGSLADAIALHPQRDQLVLDSITALIQRGFLETADPDVLIRLSRTITDGRTREQALSTIVVRLAKQGVATRNRDFLQRAVGLSCLIEDARTRSLTLTAIIDEATVLAVADGDLDLLRRMRDWSASLLSPEGEAIASANIVGGMITYAGNRRYPAALDEAYELAREIADPLLQGEAIQRICESYVRIGCLPAGEPGGKPDTNAQSASFRLFLRANEILAGTMHPGEKSLHIARIIDIILDSAKDRFSAGLLPPLMLFALGIRQPFERDAMAARIASLARSLAASSDSTDPYETIVHAMLRVAHVPGDAAMLMLVQQTAEQIKDPFARLMQLARIAGLYTGIGHLGPARSLLDTVAGSAGEVSGENRRVILLAECAGQYGRLAREPAFETLESALAALRSTTYDPDASAGRHLILTTAALFSRYPDDRLIALAQEIASRIESPADYAASLIPVYRMAAGKEEIRRGIVEEVRKAAGTAMIPVTGTPILLDLADEMTRAGDAAGTCGVITQAEEGVSRIGIPFLADTLRGRIVRICCELAKKPGMEDCLVRAAAILGAISCEPIRREVASLHASFPQDPPPQYAGMQELAERMVSEQYSPAQVIGLDNIVRLSENRGVAARLFCTLAVFFNSTGRTRLFRRYYETAVGEAAVIRPLSHRAYVLCDLALVLDAAGCTEKAQEMMDAAIDAATGIRQYAERDEVFENLAAAMRWMGAG